MHHRLRHFGPVRGSSPKKAIDSAQVFTRVCTNLYRASRRLPSRLKKRYWHGSNRPHRISDIFELKDQTTPESLGSSKRTAKPVVHPLSTA
jgi:hypothetical protein